MTGPRGRIVTSLLLVAGAVTYLGMDATQRLDVPDDASWDEAAQVVRARWKDGDLLVFSPAWAWAGAPRFAGLKVEIAELPDWYEAAKHPRVWVVASPPLREPALPEGWQEIERTETGGITVHLWSYVGQTLVWDGLASLKNAKVVHGDGAKRQNCSTWQDGKWHCGGAHPWQNVGPMDRDLAGRVRRVIWAHARDNGDPLEIRWPQVPEGRTLTIHLGQTQRAIEQAAGDPVQVQVRIGDQVAIERTLGFDESGWFRYDLDIAGRGTVDVTVRVSAQNNFVRQFCFTADVWR